MLNLLRNIIIITAALLNPSGFTLETRKWYTGLILFSSALTESGSWQLYKEYKIEQLAFDDIIYQLETFLFHLLLWFFISYRKLYCFTYTWQHSTYNHHILNILFGITHPISCIVILFRFLTFHLGMTNVLQDSSSIVWLNNKHMPIPLQLPIPINI